MTATVSAETYDLARFLGVDEFKHFHDPDRPKCFACNSELLKSEPLLVTDEFMLIEATVRLDNGSFRILPACWLVFPREHVTSYFDLPDNWTASLKQAVRYLGLDYGFNTSENLGSGAGQTAEHLHTWIIGRVREEGLFCHETGLATLIHRVKELCLVGK